MGPKDVFVQDRRGPARDQGPDAISDPPSGHLTDPALWQRLQDHSFPLDDQGMTLRSYLDKKTQLAGSGGLNFDSVTAEKSKIAVQEYRRFLYLAAISDGAAVPSPLIERLWQTHITHSKVYFDQFSPRIMGRVIHHTPGRDSAAMDQAYLDTLELYRVEFGVRAFEKVWPNPETAAETKRKAHLGLRLFGLAAIGIVISPLFGLGWGHVIPFLGLSFAALILFGLSLPSEWSVKSRSDGSGCSSCGCGGGDGGGCGGD